MPSSPRVFISYSHGTDVDNDRVLAFAARLVSEGVDAMIDQWEVDPPGGWQLWMEQQIKQSAFILIICTETYRKNVEDPVQGQPGAGVFWEMNIIRSYLYGAKGTDRRFIPVYFGSSGGDAVPTILQSATYYQIDSAAGYTNLYRRLTDQPAVVRPGLGGLVVLPRHVTDSHLVQEATRPVEHEAGLAGAAPFQKLQPMSSSDEKSLRSLAGEVSTLIRFDNYRKEAVLLYWLNYEGVRVDYGLLEAGRSRLQQTFVTHPWVVAETTAGDNGSTDGKAIAVFQPVAQPGIADIE